MIKQTVRSEPVVEHVIDLDLPPSQRLAKIIEIERDAARELFDGVMAQFEDFPSLLIPVLAWLYRIFDGPYKRELKEWADALGLSFSKTVLVNCAYELEHFDEIIPKPFGCTTGLCPFGGNAMAHVRSLDWPIPVMAKATRLLRYQKGKHQFVSVGFPMFVGVLSGMVPGAYSVTINWAPPVGLPNFHHGPSFLLRKVLEDCLTYDSAVARLSRSRLSTSVFFTVCGKSTREGCIIERTKNKAIIRQISSDCEAQSNHHVASEFVGNNQAPEESDDLLIRTTRERREKMLAKLGSISRASNDLSALFDLLSDEPVTNEQTIQRMVLCPARGELHFDRRLKASKTEMEWGRSVWKV